MSDDENHDISATGSGIGKGKRSGLEIDAEMVDEDLSASRKSTSDIEGDLDRALADEENAVGDPGGEPSFDLSMQEKPPGGFGKFVAPLLVLVAAAGAGGFIVMNPEILGVHKMTPAVTAASHMPDSKGANIALSESSDISEHLPQPTAAQNGAPAHTPLPPSKISASAPAAPSAAQWNDPLALKGAAAPAAQPPGVKSDASEAAATKTASTSNSATDKGNAGKAADKSAAVKPEVAGQPATPDSSSSGNNSIKLAQADTTEHAAPPALSAPASLKSESSKDTGGDKAELADIARDMSKNTSDEKPEGDAMADVHAPQPAQDELSPPKSVSGAGKSADDDITPSPGEAGTANSAEGVKGGMPLPSRKAASKDDDTYYDSEVTLPSGQLATAVGPRKVDPTKEPGQKLVVVEGVRKPTDPESVLVSASRALKLGRYDAALEMYDDLYKKNPRDPRILMGRAVAQQNLGQTDSAIQSYGEVLEVAPGNPDAMVNMLGLMKATDPGAALHRMLDLHKKFPNHPGLAAQIGITEGEMGNYADAMKYLGEAESLEPGNPQHPFNMAVLADRQGNTADAIKFYEQALQVDSVNGDDQSIPRDKVYDRLATLRRQ